MDTKAVTEHIRRILTAPDVDLATISSKKVRKVLAESFGAAAIKEHKEAIDALIIDAFNRIATAAGAAAPAATAPSRQEQQATASDSTAVDSKGHVVIKSEHDRQSTAQNGGSGSHHRVAESSTTSSSKQRDRQKQHQPEESEASEDNDDDEDDASASESEAEPRRQQHLKQSPQKKKVTSASSSFPASSPNVPLSMASTALTDEEYARKLQEEFNSMGGGRATRGGASRTTKKAKRGKSSSSKGASSSSGKYRSKAYIGDSDLEGEEGHDGRSDENDDSTSDVPKKKKRKTGGGGGGGTGGGYNKELALSEPLQKVCGVPTMSRPKIVKRLWEYIREHELQDPNKRSDIINDDLFKEIFGVEKMTMFSMNKYLTKSVSPIEG